jgi:hypothetical protein
LVKFTIRDYDGIDHLIKSVVLVSFFIALLICFERLTGKNLFLDLGGRPQSLNLLEDRVRCKGPFGHSILAGMYGATITPLFIYLYWGNRVKKRTTILGVISALLIVVNSMSSGPYIACVSGLLALLLWFFRNQLRLIQWGIGTLFVGLIIAMNAPVWSLVAKIKVFSSSTGDHRFILFDNFIKRIDEWWLLGTKSTEHWGYYLFDVTNMYVRVGVDGGIITLTLFLFLIYLCYIKIGLAIKHNSTQKKNQKCLWALGSSLTVNVVAFMGVSYWDQIIVIWYTLLSLISIATITDFFQDTCNNKRMSSE